MVSMHLIIKLMCHPFTFCFVVAVILYCHLKRKANYWQQRGINGPKALPVIGNLLDNFKTPQNQLEDYRFKKYGPVYGTLHGTRPVLTVGDPELLKQMLITDFHIFMNHRDLFPDDPFMGKVLIDLKGNDWRRLRATLSPAFTTGKLKGMQPLIMQCIQQSMNHLSKIVGNGKEINITRMTLAYTLDLIAKCVFGVNTDAIENPSDEFVMKAQDFATIRLWRVLSSLLVPSYIQLKFDMQLIPGKLTKYFSRVLLDILSKRRDEKQDKVDFVTLLLSAEYKEEMSEGFNYDKGLKETKAKLTEKELISNCIHFFSAGYETTSTFLQFTLYALAMNPEVQQEVYEEINEYFGKHETVEFHSLNKLLYFDAVCNESLRLYSPITSFEHICGENYKLGEVIIEKGVIINLPMYAMHHDPKLFPNPYKFIPERFMPENKGNIKPYSFIPFALGPRMCIGNRFSNYHSKLFLANFIKLFEIRRTEKTPEKPEYNGKFVMLSCKEINAQICRRNVTKTE